MSKQFKEKLIAMGFNKKEGVNFNDEFSHVVNHVYLRMLLAMVAKFDLELKQMNMKTAFLYGDLDETFLMTKPEGYAERGKEFYV